ncbi:hypothetical protein SDC9_201727 [bioreactor metagenome]|uniref:Uncharacterized protein n=1 Tax=bioreactor metagenome TaxID=1076179 RepID=A0A645IRR3_9ZZZZ
MGGVCPLHPAHHFRVVRQGNRRAAAAFRPGADQHAAFVVYHEASPDVDRIPHVFPEIMAENRLQRLPVPVPVEDFTQPVKIGVELGDGDVDAEPFSHLVFDFARFVVPVNPAGVFERFQQFVVGQVDFLAVIFAVEQLLI